ncbi:TIR domain-containing protein [Anaerocolumna jejuensis DSM 15929]|uniref:TIR domain-containing protein n=1 Tax=Anaerocolumna jejuensis DSM 15929 TaxID=1121322 RepID=A0A1M6X033_9FIRM|nr:toll/interleukin-1 receptor domain-containing protein [Anaerocolumna jejuensis]SHK99195.1 TIR domain-containing protein [Anaerocolumna jejuensis DSM 15929]
MARVFLSHSSTDKTYVRKVAELLGYDNCICDEYEFEIGTKTINEVFKSLDKTDIFVYFISNDSLNSEWVKIELNNAIEKLGIYSNRIFQIYPLIIDTNIRYDDERIAYFLRKGFLSYNLRHIDNPKIAFRKIKSRLINILMESDTKYENKYNFFYGRDKDKLAFKSRIDDLLEGPLKCVVISGISGVGRKSFVRAALQDAKIIESYYYPMIITLNRNESINDLILKLSDLGLGELKLEDIIQFNNIEDKIDILSELLIKAQEYKEHIIIEDNMCLVNLDGNVKFWFEKSLQKIKPQLSVYIISTIRLDEFRIKKRTDIYYIPLSELSKTDTAGLLRTYSKIEDIEFSREDIEFMQNCLSGYPPQVKYCVDLAKKENIDYVKEHSYIIDQMPEQISSEILLLAIDESNEDKYKSLLALLADFETTPITIINNIIKNDEIYREAFYKFKSFSICYAIGSSNEYIKINSFLQNFIQRNNYLILDDIKQMLINNAEEFEKKCNSEVYTDAFDFSELSYYIKANIKKGKKIPEKFLYSTVFLQSVIELYNKRQYSKVISIVNTLIENNKIETYDDEISDKIMYYFCLALARKRLYEFDARVEYFKTDNRYNTYNFLKGFNYRLAGNFEFAENSYNRVLAKNSNDMKTRRELVSIYVSSQQYDMAFDLAKLNFYKDKNNIYSMQAYFECLLHKKNRTDDIKNEIDQIVELVKKLYRKMDNNGMYYQIMGNYEAAINKNKKAAIKCINEGIINNKSDLISYLLKDLFDIYNIFDDVKGMNETYIRLKNEIAKLDVGDSRLEAVLIGKEAILKAYQGSSLASITILVNQNRVLSQKSKENIINNIKLALAKLHN